MKNLLFITVILLFCHFSASSQSCLPEGIVFETQSQIDSFQVNFPNCTEIEGNVMILWSDITNLNGLSVLTSIGGNLDIRGTHALTSLSGLDNVTSIGGNLDIAFNEVLTSLSGLDNVASIGGDLWIGYIDALTSLSGLDNVTSIGGHLYIGHIYALTSLSGLDNVASIGGHLDIAFNEVLTSLSGLDNVTSIEGELSIYYNNALTSLAGLDNVASIGGYLSIYENNALTSLTGLDNVTSIGGDLSIGNNPVLTSLSGLDNVASIGGHLQIDNNESLTSLSGLDNIEAESIEDLIIVNNPYLFHCYVLSICNYLANPNGTIEIDNNTTGCDSPEEVLEACHNSIYEINPKTQFDIYPNPCSGAVHLRYTNSELRTLNFELYSIEGIKIRTLFDGTQQPGEYELEFDIGDLPAGMYFVRMLSGEAHSVSKLVVMH